MVLAVCSVEDAATLLQKFRQYSRHDEPYADTTHDGLRHILKRWIELFESTAVYEEVF
jgi:hypothetical protein